MGDIAESRQGGPFRPPPTGRGLIVLRPSAEPLVGWPADAHTRRVPSGAQPEDCLNIPFRAASPGSHSASDGGGGTSSVMTAAAAIAAAVAAAHSGPGSPKKRNLIKKYFYEMPAIMAQNMAEMYEVFESTSFVSLVSTLSVI